MTETVSESPRTTWNVYKTDTQEIKKLEDIRDLSQPEVFRFLLLFYKDKGRLPTKKEEWDIFLRDQISKKEIYIHLKEHPADSRFMFKKYTDQQNFIRELCDPENPIHVPEVLKELSEKFQIENLKEDISEFQTKKIRLQGEVNKLSSEISEKSSELSEIENRLLPMKVDKESLEKEAANIRSDEGIQRLEKFIGKVTTITTSIIQGSPELHILKERKIGRDQLQLIEDLRDDTTSLSEYLKSNDFINSAKLDSMREALYKEMERIAEDNKTYAGENIGKNEVKVIEMLSEAISPYDNLKGSEIINGFQMGRLIGVVQDAIQLLQKSQVRFENIKRRIK